MVYILGLSSPPSGGKDTAAIYLERYPNVHHLKCADPLQDLTAYLLGLMDQEKSYKKLFQNHVWKDGQYYEINGKLYTPRQIQKILGKSLRTEFGQEFFAWWLSQEINKLPDNSFIVVSDIRRPPEVEALQQFSNSYLCYIHNPKAEQDFESNPEHANTETEAHHDYLKEQADFHIQNDGSLNDYFYELDQIYQKIRFPEDN